MNLDHLFSAFDGTHDDNSLPISVPEIREVLDGFASLLNHRLPRSVAIHADIVYQQIDGESLTLDVLVPPQPGPHPVLVYFHGGAWVWGSPASHRKLTCRLAQLGFLTLSVDYRLAPEHPFPAGFNDCVHAVHFAAANAHRWHGDANRLVLAGDSAGANLAAATAIELASLSGVPHIMAIALFYGVFDFTDFADTGVTHLLQQAYLGEQASKLSADPRVSPLKGAKLLPPTHIAVGTGDPLLADAQLLHTTLQAANKVSELCTYEDMPHAFAQMEFFADARRAQRAAADFLHRQVGNPAVEN